MNKHTDGEWYAKDLSGPHDQALVISETTGANIAAVYDKRDAKLIAAAPDLLAALHEAYKAFAFDETGAVWADSTIDKVEAALRKATT